MFSIDLLTFLNIIIFTLTVLSYAFFFLQLEEKPPQTFFLFRSHCAAALTLYCLLTITLLPSGLLYTTPLLMINGTLLMLGLLFGFSYDSLASKTYKKYSFYLFLVSTIGGGLMLTTQYFSQSALMFSVYLMVVAFVYYFLLPAIFSYSKVPTNKKMFRRQMRNISLVCSIVSYAYLLVLLFTSSRATIGIIILGLLLGMIYFGYLHIYEKKNFSLFFLLLGLVSLYTHSFSYLGNISFPLFVLLILLLPIAFILVSHYTTDPTYLTTYTMHYFGLAFMLYMTLRAIF